MSLSLLGGKLIVVEGIDGAGKTSFINALVDLFDKEGVPVKTVSALPYGPIRELLLGDYGITGPARAALYRVGHDMASKEVTELLQDGGWVIMDRGWLSHICYQGHGEGLLKYVEYFDRVFEKTKRPDYLIYLDVEPEVAIQRIMARATEKGEAVDTVEARGIDFQRSVREAFIHELEKLHNDAFNTSYLISLNSQELPVSMLATIAFEDIKENCRDQEARLRQEK